MPVPVGLLCDPDRLLPSHSDTSGTGDECVGEPFQGPHLLTFQRLAVSQLLVGFLQLAVVHPLDLQLLQVQPEDSVNVSCTPALELGL